MDFEYTAKIIYRKSKCIKRSIKSIFNTYNNLIHMSSILCNIILIVQNDSLSNHIEVYLIARESR